MTPTKKAVIITRDGESRDVITLEQTYAHATHCMFCRGSASHRPGCPASLELRKDVQDAIYRHV